MIRVVRPSEYELLAELAAPYKDKLMPYALTLEGLLGMPGEHLGYYEGEETESLRGALHLCYDSTVSGSLFLRNVVQVPNELMSRFERTGGVFVAQFVCPDRGSAGKILEYLKKEVRAIYAYSSVKSLACSTCERHGLKKVGEVKFWNLWKGDYSTFNCYEWL